MKNIIIILALFVFSCSNNQNYKKDIEKIMNDGETISFLDERKFNKEIFNINSVNYTSIIKADIFNKANIYFSKSINFSDFLVLNNNNIVVVDKNSKLFLIDKNFKELSSTKLNFTRDQKDYKPIYKIASDNVNIFISDNLGNLYAINIKTFKILWKKNLSVPFSSDIKLYKDNIYLINSNSKLFSISKKDGSINWSFETPSKLIKSAKGNSIEIINDSLFFSNDFGELYNLDLITKTIKWTVELENKFFLNQSKVFKISNFVTDNDKVYFSSNYGELYSVDIKTGVFLWKKSILNSREIFLQNRYLIFVNDDNFFFILNKSNGNILFKKNLNIFLNNSKFNNVFLNIILDKKFINLIYQNIMIKINNKNLNDIVINSKNIDVIKYYSFGSNIYIATKNKLLKL